MSFKEEASEANAIDQDIKIVADIINMIEGNNSLERQLKVAIGLIYETLTVAATFVGFCLNGLSALICLGIVGQVEHQAAFGILQSITFIFFFALYNSNLDKMGIELSQAFGNKAYDRYKRTTTQGLIVVAVVFLVITMPITLFSEAILTSVGVSESNSVIVGVAMRNCIPMMIISMIADVIRTFCMAQGHESLFGKISLFTTLICFICNYLFIVKYGMLINGYVFATTICYSINLAVAIYVISYTEPQTRGLVSWSEAMVGFKEFFTESIKFTLGSYAEYIGFETTSYFVAT